MLLCDSCNAEAHIGCLGLDEVPKEDWLCTACRGRSTRNANGDVGGDKAARSEAQNAKAKAQAEVEESIQKYRFINQEELLYNRRIDERAAEDGVKVR